MIGKSMIKLYHWISRLSTSQALILVVPAAPPFHWLLDDPHITGLLFNTHFTTLKILAPITTGFCSSFYLASLTDPFQLADHSNGNILNRDLSSLFINFNSSRRGQSEVRGLRSVLNPATTAVFGSGYCISVAASRQQDRDIMEDGRKMKDQGPTIFMEGGKKGKEGERGKQWFIEEFFSSWRRRSRDSH